MTCAALWSRSWTTRHAGHDHWRTCSGSSSRRCPHAEQVLLDANHRDRRADRRWLRPWPTDSSRHPPRPLDQALVAVPGQRRRQTQAALPVSSPAEDLLHRQDRMGRLSVARRHRDLDGAHQKDADHSQLVTTLGFSLSWYHPNIVRGFGHRCAWRVMSHGDNMQPTARFRGRLREQDVRRVPRGGRTGAGTPHRRRRRPPAALARTPTAERVRRCR
jgi:hypothetical protein